MRKVLALAAALVFGALPALAQVGLPWPGPGTAHSAGGGGGYTGPGDITSFTGWWGLRAFTGAIAAAGTQALVNLSRNSDLHTCDILVGSSGGFANTANCSTPADNGQSASSFCNATTCKVLTVYDQTGGGRNLTQAAATAPTIVFNCLNTSLPCINSDAGVGQQLAGPSFTPGAARQVSISVVGEAVTGAASAIFFEENGANNFVDMSGANTWTYFGGNSGTFTSTLSDSAFHAANLAIDLTTNTSTFNGDGTETTSTAINNNTLAGVLTMAREEATGVLKQTEAGFIDAVVWTGTIRTNLCHNQRLYYATPGAC